MAQKVHVAFTGTRHGMSNEQKKAILELMKWLVDTRGVWSWHHGDCIGADYQFSELCAKHYRRITLHCHPPLMTVERAFTRADIEHGPLDYLDRNREMIDQCSILLAAPNAPEHTRSGTWSTVRYASYEGLTIYTATPAGDVSRYFRKRK